MSLDGITKPSPAHLHSRSLSHIRSLDQVSDPNSHHRRPLPDPLAQSQMNPFEPELGQESEQDIAPPPYNIANVHSSGPGPDSSLRMRERSDSRSGEMGFGQSHHARNHLL